MKDCARYLKKKKGISPWDYLRTEGQKDDLVTENDTWSPKWENDQVSCIYQNRVLFGNSFVRLPLTSKNCKLISYYKSMSVRYRTFGYREMYSVER